MPAGAAPKAAAAALAASVAGCQHRFLRRAATSARGVGGK